VWFTGTAESAAQARTLPELGFCGACAGFCGISQGVAQGFLALAQGVVVKLLVLEARGSRTPLSLWVRFSAYYTWQFCCCKVQCLVVKVFVWHDQMVSFMG